MTFEEYVRALYQDIPIGVCEGLLMILCLGVAANIGFYGWKRGWPKIAGLALVEYVFLIYCSTVVYRTYLETRGHNFVPFWSYSRPELMAENVMNVAVFVPVGVLLALAFRSIKWWKVLSIGCLISVSIEMMQYVSKRGFAETDDVMHNTLGCILGYILVKGTWWMVKGCQKLWKQL